MKRNIMFELSEAIEELKRIRKEVEPLAKQETPAERVRGCVLAATGDLAVLIKNLSDIKDHIDREYKGQFSAEWGNLD